MGDKIFILQDRYADKRAIPPIDDQQDYELTQESDGKTLLKFKRKFDTCDPRDRKLEVSFFLVIVLLLRAVFKSKSESCGELLET